MNVPYTHAPESDLQRSGQLRLLVSATGEVVGLSGDSKIVSERDLWGSRIADLFDEADYFFEELCGGGHNQVQVHLRTSEYGNWVLAKGSQVRGQFRIEVSTDSVKETPSPQEVAKASAPPTPSRAADAYRQHEGYGSSGVDLGKQGAGAEHTLPIAYFSSSEQSRTSENKDGFSRGEPPRLLPWTASPEESRQRPSSTAQSNRINQNNQKDNT